MREVIINGKYYLEHELSCPLCGEQMSLKKSKFGLFYGCPNYFITQCRGSYKAYPDGAPKDAPVEARIILTRKKTKEMFKKLCESCDRKVFFSFICEKLQISRSNFNIENFSLQQCEILQELIKSRNE